MAIQDIKEAQGYTPNPIEVQQDLSPAEASANTGDAPPPAPSVGLAPQVSSVVPGEVVQPQAQILTPDNADTSALANGISNALGGILEAVAPDNPDPNTPAPVLEPPANPQGGTAQPRTGLLATMAPEAYNSAQGTMSVASVHVTPDVYKPNERGYTSVLPAILGQEKPPAAPTSSVEVNPDFLGFVKEAEGFYTEAYPDPGSRDGTPWTIGYGQTRINGRPVQPGDRITQAEADQWLANELNSVKAHVQSLVETPLTENQLNALTSFAYNVGNQAFKDSTLLRRINEGKLDDVPNQLMRWVNNDGNYMEGLANRRKKEIALWSTG